MTPNSNVDASFKCENGHEFIANICNFTRNPTCEKCRRERYSFQTMKPQLMKFWDYDRMPYKPNEISVYDERKGYWKCTDCGYSWEQSFINRGQAEAGKCPSCDLGRVFSADNSNDNNFRNHNPEAAKFWIDEMNNGITPDNVAYKSAKSVYLRCINNEKHIYLHRIFSIPLNSPYGCPFCRTNARVAFPSETDIFTLCEDAKDMWDWDLNKEAAPTRIVAGSTKEYMWKCKNGHSFPRTAMGFKKSSACPLCKIEKSSIASFPHMVKQWNFKRNKGIDINLTPASSKDDAFWKCKMCGYEWTAQICSRKLSKGWCPCCENRTVIEKGINDLFTVVPDIKEDYDFEKNKEIDPYTIGISEITPVFWKCHECGYEWDTSPDSRIQFLEEGKYKLRNCPACAGLRRRELFAEEYPDLFDRFDEDLLLNQRTDSLDL